MRNHTGDDAQTSFAHAMNQHGAHAMMHSYIAYAMVHKLNLR